MPKTAVKQKRDTERKLENFRRLLAFDRQQMFRGKKRKPQCLVVGTDEVGRGCYAGPVVAAAVLLPAIDERSDLADSLIELNDSKLLKPEQRERLAHIIHRVAVCEIAEATVEEINEINILHASLRAMKRALDALSTRIPDTLPVLVLVDGNKAVTNIECKYVQSTVVDGDAISASIAAASIIAKVHRDRLMMELAKFHPQYHWDKNKGYGSRAHRDALKLHGTTVWHRRVWCEGLFDSEELSDMPSDDQFLALLES